ncbi:hypothetical protein U3A55_01765 [Salarchaeum sp. III]|uniref:hypothetical protein n=1 Tax=Salarchaeum sp. III TaxID=3107927 RepID=UPI002EDAA267
MNPRRRPDLVSFRAAGDGTVTVTDDVTEAALSLYASGPVSLRSAVPALFPVPVDDAVAFETSGLVVGTHTGVLLRDEDGTHLGEFNAAERSLGPGTYVLDIECGMKVLLRVDGPLTGVYESREENDAPLTLTFDGETTVTVGARSRHNEPNHTITVPDDPRALMTAVSYTGSSLKEFSPERSWPTLRGHPPAFEPGDELRIPDAVSQPDTGVTITVPETYADVYEVAPLAYYLGATVEPGDPAIHLDNGYTHHFSRDEPLADGVESVLARAFFFDTLARIGGYNALPRTEYDAVAADLPFYPENLYDASIPDALVEYLEVSLDDIADVFPRWPTVAVLPDSIDGVGILAPVLDMLAPVRVRSADSLLAAGHALGPDGPLPGVARTPAAAFANARAPAPPVVEDTRVVVVSDDADRRRALSSVRESDGWPALPADRLTVTDGLDGGERADALVLDTDTVPDRDAVASLSPRVLLARDTGRAPVDALFDRGLVTALAYDDLRVDALARVLAALAVTFPVTDALDAAGVARDRVRVTGLPYGSLCRRAGGGYPLHLDAHSTGPDDHEVTVRLPVAHFGLGSVSNHDHRLLRDDYALSGRTARLPTALTTAEFVELASDIDGVVWLNDTSLAGVHPLTEDAVRENARRALADSTENDRPIDR